MKFQVKILTDHQNLDGLRSFSFSTLFISLHYLITKYFI